MWGDPVVFAITISKLFLIWSQHNCTSFVARSRAGFDVPAIEVKGFQRLDFSSKVFLCGTKDFTRKEDHSPETQCSLKTWTKPASAYVAIKWVEQSSSSCQKSYHSGSLGSRASHETTLHPTWNKTVDSCSSNQVNKHFVPLLSFSSFHLMWLIVRWPVQLF